MKKRYTKTKKNIRRHTHKQRGGIWPFTEVQARQAPITISNAPLSASCPKSNIACDIFDSQPDPSARPTTWNACIFVNNINNHILYITPNNVVIKSIETLQIPEFNLFLGKASHPVPCKLMIEDKYVACFLLICGKWYAIMRLFGTTINTGIMARTEKNKAYYELNNACIKIDETTSKITLADGNYNPINTSAIFSTSKTNIVKLADNCYKNIDKKVPVFNVLQTFRRQKVIGNSAKVEVANDVADGIFDFILR